MFERLQRYIYDNTETEFLGRRLFIQERIKLGDCPVYQILVKKENRVQAKINLNHVELISLYYTWKNPKIEGLHCGKKKIVKKESTIVIYHLTKGLWKKKSEISFTHEEEKYFLNHIKKYRNLEYVS